MSNAATFGIAATAGHKHQLTKHIPHSITPSALSTSIQTQTEQIVPKAGEGNRTLVFSLEGCGSTIELRPQPHSPLQPPHADRFPNHFKKTYSDPPAENIYSSPIQPKTLSKSPHVGGVGFEPTKAMPSDLQSDPFDRSGNPPWPH